MKKYLLLPLIVCSLFGFSQQKQFNISWESPRTLETSTASLEVPGFDKKHFNFTYKKGLIFFSQWEESNYINENSVCVKPGFLQ
ncbi:hypothetical protein [Formosa sp. Hel1_31_208]|uniref:type IX secretion system sortase PorU, long form n=1 Tax=Formosa sp. Hel1_31_208 TaxID=1798225 RepID=UPI001E2A7E12|nr:hypothetical protein [Formosa sp. Hel1_31_208]